MTRSAPTVKPALPRPLKGVGIGLIVFGSLAALLTLGGLARVAHPIVPLIGVAVNLVAIIAGAGLLKLRPRYRLLAMCWLGFVMIFSALSAVLTFTAERPILRLAPPAAGDSGNLAVACAFFILAAICYRVLTRADIQARFFKPA